MFRGCKSKVRNILQKTASKRHFKFSLFSSEINPNIFKHKVFVPIMAKGRQFVLKHAWSINQFVLGRFEWFLDLGIYFMNYTNIMLG